MTKYPQDDFKPYDDGRSKTEQVEAMFDRIAPQYDRMNRTMSFGTDRGWRRLAIRHLRRFAPRTVLDVATGTGDFAIEAFRGLNPDRIVATDISEGMMEVGRRKVERLGLGDRIVFQREDSQAFSFADGTFDAVTVAFGVRNFEDLDKGLSEMHRVLRPGGQLAILELTVPERRVLRWMYNFYASVIIPALGRVMSADGRAYVYLPTSIRSFPQGEAMRSIIAKAGFRDVKFRRLTFGACTFYTAVK